MGDLGQTPPSSPGSASVPSQVVLPDGTQPIPLGSGVITAKLGEGGMAAVYEIWNSQLEVYHAVKLINPSSRRDSLERFQTEIKITAKLHHPNIIEIHAVGQWNGIPYIEMEKVEGTTLDEAIKKRGAIPVPVCTAVAVLIARALYHAHNHTYQLYGTTYHGIIHRDLKPGNIMICSNGAVKLMDFGVARPTEASFHTMEGQVIGTLQYLSPEQLNGEALDVRTDIYAFGATLYEMLCGVRAFPEKNIHKLVADKSANRYRPLEEYRVPIPPRLRRLVRKCMVHDRSKRVPTAKALSVELEKIHRSVTALKSEEVMERFVQKGEGKKVVLRTRHLISLKTVAVVCVLAAVGILAARYLPSYLRKLRQSPGTPPAPMVIRDTVRLQTTAERTASSQASKKKAVLKAASPAVSVPGVLMKPPSSTQPKSLLEALIEKHGTNDLAAILTFEYQAKNYKTVAEVFGHLSADQKSSAETIIYTMRSLEALGDNRALTAFLKKYPIDDSEYYLTLARLAWAGKDFKATAQYLDQSLGAPRKFIEYDKLKQETAYYRALCATAEFDANPSEVAWKTATGAWFEVKSQMRILQAHPYYKKAEEEIRRIGEKFRQRGG